MTFEAAEIPYNKESYFLKLDQENIDFAEKFKQKYKLNKPIVGINTGCGPVYPYKKWQKEGTKKKKDKLNEEGVKVILFGGPDEEELNNEIKKKIKTKVIDAGYRNTITNFAALLDLCDVIFTGDTIALHIAIALNKPTIAVFGPTPSQEIRLIKGKKLIGKVPCLNCYNQFPCIMDEQKKPNCMQTITVKEVLNAINEFIRK